MKEGVVVDGCVARGRAAGTRKGDERVDCWAVLHFSRARAEHLRCKILNPSASAISPTSSAGRSGWRKREGGERCDIRERGKGLEAAPFLLPRKGVEDTARRLCGAHSASLHLNVKVPSAARRKLLFCIRKLMIASELCFWRGGISRCRRARSASLKSRRLRFRDGTRVTYRACSCKRSYIALYLFSHMAALIDYDSIFLPMKNTPSRVVSHFTLVSKKPSEIQSSQSGTARSFLICICSVWLNVPRHHFSWIFHSDYEYLQKSEGAREKESKRALYCMMRASAISLRCFLQTLRSSPSNVVHPHIFARLISGI